MTGPIRRVDQWVLPLDSSWSVYREEDFNPAVLKACRADTNGPETAHLAPVGQRLRIAKCNVVGDASVGKTSLINRFGYDVFDADAKATIGVDFDVQKFEILQRPFTLQIWDTAGHERFRPITRTYYRGAHAAIIVFDLAYMSSFRSVPHWHREILDAVPTNGPPDSMPFIFLVGAKKDLITDDTVAFFEIEGPRMAEQIGAEFWMVSSTTGENVTELFNRVACLCFDRYMSKELRVALDRPVASISPTSSGSPAKLVKRKPSVRFSSHNGGQITHVITEDRYSADQVGKSRRVLDAVMQWWAKQWTRATASVSPSSPSGSPNNNSAELKARKRRKKTLKCFNFTCMVSVD